MRRSNLSDRIGCIARIAIMAVGLALHLGAPGYAADPPLPLLAKGEAVDWWFVFKFNATSFRGCKGDAKRSCPFGGGKPNTAYGNSYSQQYVFASSKDPKLKEGEGCAGDTTKDPIGATFGEIYNGDYYYVVWNDQFDDHPKIPGCSGTCSAPWGHSKGMVAWNEAGDGIVIQVSTPSWPGSGSKDFERDGDGNSLGCTKRNNVKFSQHFFALRLDKSDLMKVLEALRNASVATNPKNEPNELMRTGGPPEVQALARRLGSKSDSMKYTKEELSSKVIVISKPSSLNVPPWQMVSALLGQEPLRVATWWGHNKIYSTTPSSRVTCWDGTLDRPGPVEIAITGQWEDGTDFKLTSGANHAKIGISDSGDHHYAIFGDMNQEGALLQKNDCTTSQNGRGGLFFAINNEPLHKSISKLLQGKAAGTKSK
jgi:hypothetical protein